MIVEIWTKIEVRALRDTALRMTQEQFAEQIGWSVATVRKWERATESRPVRGQRAADLDSWLAKLSPEQMRRFALAVSGPRPAAQRHSPSGGVEDEADVNRREFGRAAALTAATLPQWNPSRIGMADVDRLNTFTAELEAAQQRVGGAGLVPTAVDALERSQALVHNCVFDDATGRAWMSAVGELAVQTGWLAYDAERTELAWRCYSDALSLAFTADDDDLTAHACLNAALQTTALARVGRASPSYALALIRRAGSLVRRRPAGRIHAPIAAREAAAHGTAGDWSSVQRSMSGAWREMDNAIVHEPVDECAPWLWFVSHSEIRFHEARACTDSGRHEQGRTCSRSSRANLRARVTLRTGQPGSRPRSPAPVTHGQRSMRRHRCSMRSRVGCRLRAHSKRWHRCGARPRSPSVVTTSVIGSTRSPRRKAQ